MAKTWIGELFEKIKSMPDQAAVDELTRLARQLPETAFVEFKRTNLLEPSGALAREDAHNIARCLSGFANSSGGLLILGFTDNQRDLAAIPQVAAFEAATRTYLGYAVEPSIRGLDLLSVPTASNEGIILLYVPESFQGPHQIVAKAAGTDQYRYLKRIEGRFAPLAHSEIRALFQKRLGPRLVLYLNKLTFSVTHHLKEDPKKRGAFAIELWAGNFGAAHARHIYGNIEADFRGIQTLAVGRVWADGFTLMEHWDHQTRTIEFTSKTDPSEKLSASHLVMFDSVPWIPPSGRFNAWHLGFDVHFEGKLSTIREALGILKPLRIGWTIGAEHSEPESGEIELKSSDFIAALDKAAKSAADLA